MTPAMVVLTLIILASIVLFAIDIFPVDKTSLLILSILVVSRLITPEQAVSGFGNTATITVACMLALSFGIQRTGILNYLANTIVDLGGNQESRILLSIMLAVGILSAFINNTAAVALFLPLTIAVAREQNFSASKLLMPMSFAAMFAGTTTLIGTSTNLLIYSIVIEQVGWEIGMFEFSQLGLVFFVVGIIYLLVLGRRLIVARRIPHSLTEDYRLRHFVTELLINPDSPLINKSVSETRLGELYDLEVIEIIRGQKRILPSSEVEHLRSGDILLVRGDPKTLIQIRESQGLTLKALSLSDREIQDENIVLVEAFISPTSRLIESTLKEVDFRRTFLATALAIRSHGRNVRQKIGKTPLEFGDSLLILTTREHLEVLRSSTDFLVLEEVRMAYVRRDKAYYALTIFAGIVAAASIGVVSIMEAAIIGVGLMVITGCIRLHELYGHLSWQTIIMLGCLIPLGQAMENTNLAAFLAQGLVHSLQNWGPIAVLSGLYFATTLLTSIMSNNATAVLMAPIALSIAGSLNADPKPFVIAIMFAASSSFLTPVGYQTNTFIFGPGGYRFFDFFKVGAPLNVVFWLLATILIPYFWPF